MDVDQPPSLLVLPQDRSHDAQIFTLAHPRTSDPCRFLFDPQKGIYEFTRIAAPKAACRSWLIGSRHHEHQAGRSDSRILKTGQQRNSEEVTAEADTRSEDQIEQYNRDDPESYVMKRAEMLVATPIDPLFLILPALWGQPSMKAASKELFLSADDLFEKLSDVSEHFGQLFEHQLTREMMEGRLQAVCDSVDAGDEKMYRLNVKKLLSELVSKAKRVAKPTLPASMEDRFVKRALEAPVIDIKVDKDCLSEKNLEDKDSPSPGEPSLDSQGSTASSASVESTASHGTDVTVPEVSSMPIINELQSLLRLRTALNYMISSYIPTALATMLFNLMSSEQSPIDFKPLDERLAEIAKARSEALAARSIGDFSRKRNAYEDDDAAQSRADKKRKKEEEEKNKRLESRGIKNLKKADTKGMKKMSDFFSKGAASMKK